MPPPSASRRGAYAAFPALFVVLWSTGFIAAKYGLPYAPPLKFLFVRFLCVALLMSVVALATRARWPGSLAQVLHIAVAAWLVHACYLGGVFVAISHGMPAGTSAMLVGLQPLLTVVIARLWLDERVVPLQWIGLLLGLAGVYFVVRHKVDLRSGAAIQFWACVLVYAPLVLLVDERAIEWTGAFVFALVWSVLVLSVGAISLLYWLLRHGAAADVARLFYLVPPVTAAMAFALFGERLDALALAGMVLIAGGVAMARPRP